ncbi:TonB-dependent receptor [Brevundimonas variabilis]|uniref:Iron complex outermembrane receptor protein n=1 Tax=Brevundimonas variabilis TaxID=74312 RepID=A0A7W9FF73_9CAUL|nr:TonB-dependent receptor [Brevundimonas variabilis]MBB5745124.1 iron complex outermembrane receptor protein [Brevundimonas variabilis]
MRASFPLRTTLLAATATLALTNTARAQSQEVPSRAVDLGEIVVTAAPFGISADATTIAVDVLDEETLLSAPSQSLGDILNGLPGVRSTSFSAGASRPVIRGLSGPRVQVLTNGLGLIDASSLSPDHQVAADPGEAVRIEVLRGPQTLAFGGSAIGGVVNVIDGRVAEEAPVDGLDGRITAQGSSVDDGYSVGARLAAAAGPLVFTLDGLKRDSGDYDIPVPAESRRQVLAEGEVFEDTGGTTVENSFLELEAYGAGLSYIGERGFIGASVKHTETAYGVPGHAHEEDDGAEEESVTIGLEQTRYDVRGEYRLDDGLFSRVRGALGYADYTHTEFEGGAVGTVFASQGYEGRLELIQRKANGLDGAIGVQFLDRNLDAIGDEAYVPRTDVKELAAYTLQRLDMGDQGFGEWGLEGGLRVDRRELDSVVGRRDFSNVSGSVGAFWKPAGPLFLGLSIARNGRAPTEAELFAQGPHVATRAFEVGNPDLTSERVTSIEATGHLERGRFDADLHLFHADYDGFVDLIPTGAEEDGLPVFTYVQGDATFHGLEAEVGYQAWESGSDGLRFEASYDTVRGTTDFGPPARIPPWSVTGRAILDLGPWTLKVQGRHVGEQDRVAGFELPTDSYTTLDGYVGWSPAEDDGLLLYAEVRNATDEEVREHASFLKDLTPQPGRNLRIGAAYRF